MPSIPAGRLHRFRAALLGGTALAAPLAAATQTAAQTVAPSTRPALDRVVAGGITVRQDAQRTQVTQAEQRGIVDWRSFNIGSDHQVQFQQPSTRAITLNRVTASDPSVIAGRISANGQIAIVNQSGVVFSQGAQVEAAGLIVSAAGITNQNFLAGRMVFDQAPRADARVENQGRITIREAGLAALVAPQVANRGTITARLGRVALAGAETHAVDLYGDGMLAVEVTGKVRQAPGGGAALVTNAGVIEVQGGTVQLSAAAVDGIVQDLVRVGGRVAADTDAATGRGGRIMIAGTGGAVRIEGTVSAAGMAPGTRGGTVEVLGDRVLVDSRGRVDVSGTAGGGDIALGTTRAGAAQPRLARRAGTAPGAVLRADATVSGQGGSVRINSAEYTEHAGSISARGGPRGGDGGFVEVSGQQGLRTPGSIDAGAPAGAAGTILFDPAVLEIVVSGSDSLPPGGVLGPNDPPTNATISASDINNFFGNVVLGATQDIFVRAPLSGGSAVGSLTMTAGRDVQVDAPIDNFRGLTLTAQTGELRLNARLFGNGATTLTAGGGITVSDTTGSITATSLLATAGGTVTLGSASSALASLTLSGGPASFSAGQDVLVRTRLVGGSTAGALTLTGGLDVQVDAPIVGFSGLTVQTLSGDIRLDAGLFGNGATVVQAARDVRMNAGINAGSANLTISAGGNVLAEPLAPADLIADRVSIDANGAVELGNAGIPRGPLTITAPGGTVISSGADLRIDMPVSGGSSAGSLTLSAGASLRIGQPVQRFQGLDFSAVDDVRVDAALDAGSSADLIIAAGANVFSEPRGPVAFVAERVSIVAGGAVELGNAGIARGPLTITAAGGTAISAGADLRIDMPVASTSSGTVAMDAVGNLAIANALSAAGPVRLRAGGNLAVSSVGSVTSNGSAAAITLLSGVDFAAGGGSGAVDPTAPGSLGLAGTVTAALGGPLVLGAGAGGIQQTGGRIEAGSLSIQPSGGDALLGQAANAIGQLRGVQVAGRFLLDNGTANLPVLGPVSAQSIGLRSQGVITVQGSALLAAARPGGTIALRSSGLSIQPGGQISAETVEIAPFAAAPVTLAGIPGGIAADTLRIGASTFPDTGPDPVTTATSIALVAPLAFGGTLDLRSTGRITQSAGANLTLGTLSGAAGGPVTLENTGNAMGALGGFAVSGGGPFALAAGGDLVLTGPLSVAGGTVQLRVGGQLSQTVTGAITAARLTGSAGRGALLDGAANQLGALGGFDAGTSGLALLTVAPQFSVPGGTTVRSGAGLVLTASGGALTVDGTVSGESLVLRATTDLTVNGNSAIARSGDLLLAADRVTVTGLIQAGRALSVEAASTASLSGRAAISGPPGASTGGLTVSAPRIVFGGLDATGVLVTLALGATGTATGALDTGGLIVQGGAGAGLTGSIGGVGGGTAAALGRRQTEAGVPLAEPLPRAADFTLNGCPIGAATCLPVPPPAPPRAPPLAPPLAPTAPVLVLVPLAANPAATIGVLDPTNLITQAERLRPRVVLPTMRIARDRSEQEELAAPDVRRDDY